MECIFGLRHKDSGHIYIENKEVDIKNVKTAINAGIGLVPEDRKQSGIYPIQEYVLMQRLKYWTNF